MMNRARLAVVIIWAIGPQFDFAQSSRPNPAKQLIELTRSDPFAATSWSSQDVTILGLRLGMTREQAATVARTNHFFLRNDGLTWDNSCNATDCAILESREVFTGLRIAFDSNNRISRLILENIRSVAARERRENAIQRRLKGRLSELLNNYSDELRVSVLGAGSVGERFEDGGGSFSYPHLGVSIWVHLFDQDSIPKDPLLSISFFSPQPATR